MNIKLDDIKTDPNIPEDKKFGELFKKVLLKELPFYVAIIKTEGIKPFSSYKPTPSTALNHDILTNIKSGHHPKIHVYQEDEYFIMSDDYRTYFTYLELKKNLIPCIVLGSEPVGKYVTGVSDVICGYDMSVEILENPERN